MLIPESPKSSKLDEVEGKELRWEGGVLFLKQVFSISCFCSMSTTKSIQWSCLEKDFFSINHNVSSFEDLYYTLYSVLVKDYV